MIQYLLVRVAHGSHKHTQHKRKKRVRMTKEKHWLESQGRGERLEHHAGRGEEEKVRRFYKRLV